MKEGDFNVNLDENSDKNDEIKNLNVEINYVCKTVRQLIGDLESSVKKLYSAGGDKRNTSLYRKLCSF